MKLHLLLTPEIKATMPETIKIIYNFDKISVIFRAIEPENKNKMLEGENAVVEGETQEIINWLKPFDGVPIGNGVPQMEEFTIMHIKDNL